MKKLLKYLIVTLAVLAVVVAVMALADVAFRGYERRTYIKAVDVNAKVFDLKEFSFNDHGPALMRDKAPDEFRILSIGDSYVAAITKPPFTYSAVLERDLNALGLGKRFRVVNLGIGGTSFPDYMANFLFWSKIFKFDAVVFNIYLGNDFTDVEDRPFNEALLRRDTFITGIGATLPHKFPFRFIDYAYGIMRAEHNLKPANDQYNPSYQMSWDQYVPTMVKSMRIYNPAELPSFAISVDWAARLMALAEGVERTGIKMAVIASPPHFFYDERLKRETLAMAGVGEDAYDPALPVYLLDSLRKRAGLSGAVIDPFACLASHARSGENLYYGTDTHWSVAGNKIVGDYLAGVLAERWFGVKPADAPSDCSPSAAQAGPNEASKAAVAKALAELGQSGQ